MNCISNRIKNSIPLAESGKSSAAIAKSKKQWVDSQLAKSLFQT